MTIYKIDTGATLLEMAKKFLNDGNRRPEIKDTNQLQLGSDAPERPPIKLIYRGSTYNYIPHPVVVSEEVETDGLTVTLIYRGMTYQRKLQLPKPYQKPHAINWRWQRAYASPEHQEQAHN